MFYATDEARARHFYRIINQKRLRWERSFVELIRAAFETELVGLRKAIRGAPRHLARDLAVAYLSSDANAQIWKDVWRQINLNAGSDVWKFLERSGSSSSSKSLVPNLPGLPELPSLPSLIETKAIATEGNYPTEWQNLVFQDVADKGGRLVTQVTKTTQQQVGGVLAQAIADGKSTYQMEKVLGQLYLDEIIPNRKEVIARTETARATNSATLEQAKRLNPFSLKRWIAVLDNRTRTAHRNIHYKTKEHPIPLNEPFDCEDGTTEPGQAVNCRCVTGIVPPKEYTAEMFEGKPIAKEEVYTDYKKAVNAVDNWYENLWQDERSSIYQYSSTMYQDYNDYLRYGKGKWIVEDAKKLVELIDQAPKYKGTVYRGSNVGSKRFEEITALKLGDVIEMKGIISTSAEKRIAESFASIFGGPSQEQKAVFYTIENAKGLPFRNISSYQGEEEVLLNHLSKFQVKKIEKISELLFNITLTML